MATILCQKSNGKRANDCKQFLQFRCEGPNTTNSAQSRILELEKIVTQNIPKRSDF